MSQEFITFGYWVRRRRLALDLTQAALARRVGCAEVTIKKIEYDERRPSRTMAARLAKCLEIDPDERKTFIRSAMGEAPTARLPAPSDPAAQAKSLSRPEPQPEQPIQTDRVTPVWMVAASPTHNLPIQPTSFIGRENDIQQVKDLLSDHPLVTLTGPGGVGKSRLSLQVARDLLDDFPDGVWLVELAAVSNPAHVVRTAAQTLGMREDPNLNFQDSLTYYLKPLRALLVLDNCEHVVEGCASLAAHLLASCPEIRLLATSREPLRVPGEIIYPVTSLTLPDPQKGLEPAQSISYDAVRLFLDRARAALPSFVITPDNLPQIVSICSRLDGIPLALELAAARINVLSTAQLDSRLEDIFNVLTGGSRTAPLRHRTLEAAIDWSFQMLTAKEQTLLRRLSVFVNGWHLADAEAICVGDGLRKGQVFELLSTLIDKSLILPVRIQGERTRYRMLETIRIYAHQKLTSAEEAETYQHRHTDYFLLLAEKYAAAFTRAGESDFRNQLIANDANLQTALDRALYGLAVEQAISAILALSDVYHWFYIGGEASWTQRLEQTESLLDLEQPSVELGRLMNHQGYFLHNRGMHAEAAQQLQASCDMLDALDARLDYAKALRRLGLVLKEIGDRKTAWEKASACFAESAAVFETLGAENYLAHVYIYWGIFESQFSGDFDRARELLLTADRLIIKLGADRYPAGPLQNVYFAMGQYERARQIMEENLPWERARGNHYLLMYSLLSNCRLETKDAADLEDLSKAGSYLLESFELGQKFPSGFQSIASMALDLSKTALSLAEPSVAVEWYAKILSAYRNLPPIYLETNQALAPQCLLGLAQATAEKNAAYSASLLGALNTLQSVNPNLMRKIDLGDFDRIVDATRQNVSTDTFQTAWQAGKLMSLDEAAASALEALPN